MYLFIINAPMVFSTMWSLIKPLVDPRTQNKIHIWRSNYLKELKQYIDVDQIPSSFGGTGGELEILSANPEEYRPPAENECGVVLANTPSQFQNSEDALLDCNGDGQHSDDQGSKSSTCAKSPLPGSPTPEDIDRALLATNDRAESSKGIGTLCHEALESMNHTLSERMSSFRTAIEDGDDPSTICSTPSVGGGDEAEMMSPVCGETVDVTRAVFPPTAIVRRPMEPSDDLHQNAPLTIENGVNEKGFSVMHCWHLDQLIAVTRNNLIVHPSSGAIIGELRLEEGHVWRIVVQLHDKNRVVRFAFLRRRLHKEVQVFLCQHNSGPSSVARSKESSSELFESDAFSPRTSGKKSLSHLSRNAGERLYIMSCLPTRGGDPGDWVVKAPGASPWAVHRKGKHVYWGSSLKSHEPELMFAFAVVVIHLWEWK